MTKVIYCPGPRKLVPLGIYVKAVQIAKSNPATVFKCGITTPWPTSGAEVVEQFWRGVEDRICQAQPYWSRGLTTRH